MNGSAIKPLHRARGYILFRRIKDQVPRLPLALSASFPMSCRLLALFIFPVIVVLSHAAERQPWVNTGLAGSPEPPSRYVAVRAFPKLEIKRPVAIELEPYQPICQIVLLTADEGDIKPSRYQCATRPDFARKPIPEPS